MVMMMALVEIKDFNVLIDNKQFLDQPVKNRQEAHEKLVEKPRNNDYMSGNLLNYVYYQKHYKVGGIELSRQTNKSSSPPNYFYRKIDKNDGVTMFFIVEKQQK